MIQDFYDIEGSNTFILVSNENKIKNLTFSNVLEFLDIFSELFDLKLNSHRYPVLSLPPMCIIWLGWGIHPPQLLY